MTPQEAINNIDDVLSADVNYDESLDYELTSDDIDWLEKAKEALERQTPKKPFQACGHATYSTMNFCPICGQALDWG